MSGSVVLLSGGLDSCVAAAIAKRVGPVCPVFVQYGQRHAVEERYAEDVARILDLGPLLTVQVEQSLIHPLLGDWHNEQFATTSLERDRAVETIAQDTHPRSFVPHRNAMLLSAVTVLAACRQDSDEPVRLVIGSNADDAQGYPDCRPAFFRAFEHMAHLGGTTVEILHPLTSYSKAEVVRQGRSLGAPIDQTWSCYRPQVREGCRSLRGIDAWEPCDRCDACVLRRHAFAEADSA